MSTSGFAPDHPCCYDNIPPFTRETIDNWIEHAIPTGGFLYAVLTNDLKGAINRADNENLRAIPAIVAYLYNRAPMGCWGSETNVQKWEGRNA